MANIFAPQGGIQVESPQEQQERLRKNFMAGMAQNQRSNAQQFGYAAASIFSNLFGRQKKQREATEQRWDAIAKAKEAGAAMADMDRQADELAYQVYEQNLAAGAPEEVAQQAAMAVISGSNDTRRALGMEAADLASRAAKNDAVMQGLEPIEQEMFQMAATARALKELGGAENLALAAQINSAMVQRMTDYRSAKAEAAKLKAESKTEELKQRKLEKELERLGMTETEKLQARRGELIAEMEDLDPQSAGYKRREKQVSEIDGILFKKGAVTGRTAEDLAVEGIELTSTTESNIQKDVVGLDNRIARLQEIDANFDPDLLTAAGKLHTMALSLKDRFSPRSLSEEQRDRLNQWTDLSQSAYRELNDTLKEMSGAAVTPQEAQRQLEVIPNPGSAANPFSGDTANEFERKYKRQLEWLQAARARYQDLLEQGIVKPGDSVTESLAKQHPISSYIGSQRDSGKPAPKSDAQSIIDSL